MRVMKSVRNTSRSPTKVFPVQIYSMVPPRPVIFTTEDRVLALRKLEEEEEEEEEEEVMCAPVGGEEHSKAGLAT